jgi:hypothetical protein
VAAASVLAVALLIPGAKSSAVAGQPHSARLTGAASLHGAAATSLGDYQASQRQVQSSKGYWVRVLQARTTRAAQAAARARAAARRSAAHAALVAAQHHAAKRRAASKPAASPTPAPSGSPQQIAMAMLGSYGWPASQFSCLNALWERESGWNVYASNPSGAYGIPQALPGSKMASAGADWPSDAATQIRWGLGYIQSTYGSPCGAWAHEESTGWY